MDKKKFIDFNIDLVDVSANLEHSSELIDSSSSINIPFEFNNQNPIAIKKAIELCKFKHKVIGASIVLPEGIENPLELTEDDVEAIVLYQLGAINAFATAESMNIEYVRANGLLYQLMAENLDFCIKVAKAVKKFNKWFLLYGATGSILKDVANIVGLNIAQEISLAVPFPNEFYNSKKLDNEAQLTKLRKLVNQSEIQLNDNESVKVEFDTIHFDSKQDNILELLANAKQIVYPRPVNFNNAVSSGWVE